MRQIKLGNRYIGENHDCFIVAELSANHNQDINRAKDIIRKAKECGADAVKLQTYTPDTLTIDCDNDCFKVSSDNNWDGKTLYQLYGEAYTPWEWHKELFKVAQDEGLVCFSTPFDQTAIDLLEELGNPIYKVASFELVDISLLEAIGQTGKPVIMSTGMADLSEIDLAVKTLRKAGCEELALLKCTSAYPAPPESMNLKTIPHLSNTFKVVAGLSDHTLGSAVPVAAVSLGAKIIEKHFTLDRNDGGVDSFFSLEPDEFSKMVADIRIVEKALGSVSYTRSEKEQKNLCFRRSLFAVRDIKAGEAISLQSVRSIRPGYGLSPKFIDLVTSKKAAKDIKRGSAITWELIG